MYSDLLDVLGGGAGGGLNARASRESEKHVAVHFKAGKMNMALQENGKYWITPDTRRGELQLVWQDNALKLEWLDRRDKSVVVDSFVIPNDGGGTFCRVEAKTDKDRVYLWTSHTTERHMYWMQTADDAEDDTVVAQVNQYLMNPTEAAPEGVTGNLADTNPLVQGSASTATTTAATTSGGAAAAADTSSTASSTGQQVDALSNILENLGMPQQQPPPPTSSSSATTNATPSATAAAGTGTLTLADLQGAMAGLATATPPPPSGSGTATTIGPPLSEVVTPAAITSLLEDEAVVQRLLRLLPEEQQSREFLEDNLRSPQIQQTLRTLTMLVQPDDAGSMEGYHSLLANFSLDPADGQETLTTSGNPIQAFLDCVVASVQKEQVERQEGGEGETKEEQEEKDDAMQE